MSHWDKGLKTYPTFYRHQGKWRVLGPEQKMIPGRTVSVLRQGHGGAPAKLGAVIAQYVNGAGKRWLLCEFESLESPEEKREARWGSRHDR